MTTPDEKRSEPGFIGKVLLVAVVFVGMLTAFQLALVFIIAFGGVIVAVMLNNMTEPLQRNLKLPHHPALALTTVGLTLIAIGFFTAFGTQAAVQFNQLVAQLPQAWADTRFWLDSGPVGRWILSLVDRASTEAATTLLSALPLAGGVFGWIANFLLIIVIGIYLAADGDSYVDGTLRLLPPSRRKRTREIMDVAAANLRKWLIAMTLDMLFLGTVTGVGLWLVGAPFPFPLGVLSGLSVFVPYIGPIVAIVPGLLLALSVSPELALYAGIVYVIGQQLEGNVSLPLLQVWTVHMPPALSLLAILAFGLLFGFWGVLLATPLAVVIMTIVRMAYIEDFLEKKPR